MPKQYKWQAMEIDLRAFMNYVRGMGAASIKEIKDHFHTDSASVRRVVGFLYHHQKVWLVSYRSAIYVTENTHKKGPISIASLRKKAGVVPKARGPKPRTLPITPDRGGGHAWQDEEGLKVDLAEDDLS
jgi:hypothetical protein